VSVRGVYLATEIRARLSGMTASDRRKVLATADEATVSAVLSGPGFLSGLSPLEIEAARLAWSSKRRQRLKAESRVLNGRARMARRERSFRAARRINSKTWTLKLVF
jgi:hypothetical protein